MEAAGVYHHPPGRLSRWGVVDVGLKCVHRCKFCYYSFLDGSDDQFAGMKRAEFHSTEHIRALARGLAANGFLGADVTGGEPCLHPGIVALAVEARATGLALRIITLGQYLMRPMKSALGRGKLLDVLVDAGIADFLLSVHAVDNERMDELTGGNWEKLRAAMERLDEQGFDYCTNTTVFEGNFRQLPAISDEIAKHRVYAANLIVMNAYYAWSQPGGRAAQVQGHYGELAPYVLDARDRLEAKGIAVNIRYAPLCTMRGAERNLVGITGVRHDPHEWMNAIDHKSLPQARPERGRGGTDPAGPASAADMAQRLPLDDWQPHYPLQPIADNGLQPLANKGLVATRAGKAFPASKCGQCRAIHVCDGIDRRYLAERGAGELAPYDEFRGDLLDRARLAYLPAFVVKTQPFADARGAVRQAFAHQA